MAAGLLAGCLLAPAAADTGLLAVYSRDTANELRYRVFDGVTWSSEATTESIGAEAKWVYAAACPIRLEVACLTLDTSNDVNLLIWTGATFGSPVELCATAGQSADRSVCVAYEAVSGAMLAAYWNQSSHQVGYRTYDGATLSSNQAFSLPALQQVKFITLYPRPGSDDVLLVALNSNNVLMAAHWNGSAWSGETTLETNTPTTGTECYDLAFESSSGDAVLVYGEGGQNTPRFRTWAGGTWSSENSLPSIGNPPKWISLAAKPDTDEIIFAAFDGDSDINANVWDGSGWGANFEIENKSGNSGRRQMDAAYTAAGDGVVYYAEKNVNQLRYRTWSGGAWSAEQTGSDVGAPPSFVAAMRRGAHTYLAISDTQYDFNTLSYDGATMSSASEHESTLGGVLNSEPFSLVGLPVTGVRIVHWREVPNPDTP